MTVVTPSAARGVADVRCAADQQTTMFLTLFAFLHSHYFLAHRYATCDNTILFDFPTWRHSSKKKRKSETIDKEAVTPRSDRDMSIQLTKPRHLWTKPAAKGLAAETREKKLTVIRPNSWPVINNKTATAATGKNLIAPWMLLIWLYAVEKTTSAIALASADNGRQWRPLCDAQSIVGGIPCRAELAIQQPCHHVIYCADFDSTPTNDTHNCSLRQPQHAMTANQT